MPSLRHLSVVLALALCAPLSAHAIEFSAEELARAKALQQRLVTLDSHLDTPANFGRTGFDIEQRHDATPFAGGLPAHGRRCARWRFLGDLHRPGRSQRSGPPGRA
jgi:hypothetical protein